jgi:hypothetical protein
MAVPNWSRYSKCQSIKGANHHRSIHSLPTHPKSTKNTFPILSLIKTDQTPKFPEKFQEQSSRTQTLTNFEASIPSQNFTNSHHYSPIPQ